MQITCQKINPIEYLISIQCIFKEVVSFQILVCLRKGNLIFEGDGVDRHRLVVYYLVGGLREEEVEEGIILLGKVRVDLLCFGESYL